MNILIKNLVTLLLLISIGFSYSSSARELFKEEKTFYKISRAKNEAAQDRIINNLSDGDIDSIINISPVIIQEHLIELLKMDIDPVKARSFIEHIEKKYSDYFSFKDLDKVDRIEQHIVRTYSKKQKKFLKNIVALRLEILSEINRQVELKKKTKKK